MFRRVKRGSSGQAMAEMAIVLPVFLLLLFGIIQFGIVFNHYLALTDAVRAGARTAAVSRHAACPVCLTKDRVKESAASLTLADGDITVTASPGWETGADVTVTAKYPYAINLLGVVVRSGNLTSTTVERVE